jgi:hypothetical protein
LNKSSLVLFCYFTNCAGKYPYPPPWGENMKRGRLKGESVKEKGRKGKQKKENVKKNSKWK